MKACSLLVLFCLLSVIICDTTGITVQALKDSFKESLPFVKAFHKPTISLGKGALTGLTLKNPLLTEKNADFKVENGHVTVTFHNIKFTLQGGAKVKGTHSSEYTRVTADIENFKFEIGYSVSSKKLSTGKYEVKSTKATESNPTYKLVKISSKFNGMATMEEQIKNKFKNLDFTPYKTYLVKIANLVLETLPSHMK